MSTEQSEAAPSCGGSQPLNMHYQLYLECEGFTHEQLKEELGAAAASGAVSARLYRVLLVCVEVASRKSP